jgi:membrane associated rhomboid family serine protease
MLHAGLVHYFINMLALWFVGAAIEMEPRLSGCSNHLYYFGGRGRDFECYLLLPEYITVGAGGIFGFIGASPR